MKILTAVIMIAISTILSPSLFWLGGFDFDKRGQTMVLCAITTLLTTAIGTAITLGYLWSESEDDRQETTGFQDEWTELL